MLLVCNEKSILMCMLIVTYPVSLISKLNGHLNMLVIKNAIATTVCKFCCFHCYKYTRTANTQTLSRAPDMPLFLSQATRLPFIERTDHCHSRQPNEIFFGCGTPGKTHAPALVNYRADGPLSCKARQPNEKVGTNNCRCLLDNSSGW